MDNLQDCANLAMAQKAFEKIINRLAGIDEDDLTTAEAQILKIAQEALKELTE